MSAAPRQQKRPARFSLWKALLFCALFACAFLGVQYIIAYKYEPADCWPERYADYAAEPAGSIDVVFLGTSQSYWGVSPMILWNEAGITSVNMSGIMHQHTMVYQQLLTLLELNEPPKYVVFNPSSLVQYYSAEDEKLKPVWEQFIRTLPEPAQKLRAYQAMCAEADGDLDRLGFWLPLLRYHSRWNELTEDDLRLPSYYAGQYQPFLKGQMPMMEGIVISDFVYAEEENTGFEGLIEEAVTGWEKVFALCREAGITPVALIMPRFDGMLKGEPLEAMLDFLDGEGVDVINYLDEVSLVEMEWDYRRHFKDREHLNFRGSLYCSQDLAWQLSDLFDLQDHRDDPAYGQWQADWEQFSAAYHDEIVETLGEDYLEPM